MRGGFTKSAEAGSDGALPTTLVSRHRSTIFSLAALALAIAGWTSALVLWKAPPPAAEVIYVEVPPPPLPPPPEPPRFESLLASPGFAPAAVGACLLDGSGEIIYASPLARTALAPASTLKTVTTATALEVLGPGFVFDTRIVAAAPPGPDGLLDGDLFLVGSGDPTLAPGDLATLAEAMRDSGLAHVTGNIVADATVFPEAAASDHWNWGDVGNAYGAGAFGINLGHNRFTARFEPGEDVGAPARFLGSAPPLPGIAWINLVTTGEPGSGDGVVIHGGPYTSAMTLRGTVPHGVAEFEVGGAIPDPPALAAAILRSRLLDAGVVVDGEAVVRGANAPADGVTLTSHQSPTVAAILPHLHQVSDNLEAQCLYLTIGNAKGSDPADAVIGHWETRGLAFDGIRLLDGSGLARANTIRPIDLARVVFAARHGSQGATFFESLVEHGDVRSKGGAMSGVRAQVGFLTLPDGREITFSLIANALPPGASIWELRDALLERATGRE